MNSLCQLREEEEEEEEEEVQEVTEGSSFLLKFPPQLLFHRGGSGIWWSVTTVCPHLWHESVPPPWPPVRLLGGSGVQVIDALLGDVSQHVFEAQCWCFWTNFAGNSYFEPIFSFSTDENSSHSYTQWLLWYCLLSFCGYKTTVEAPLAPPAALTISCHLFSRFWYFFWWCWRSQAGGVVGVGLFLYDVVAIFASLL